MVNAQLIILKNSRLLLLYHYFYFEFIFNSTNKAMDYFIQ